MKNVAQEIRNTRVDPGCLAVWWIAQAGFVFKAPGGKIVYTDPCLTDYTQRSLPEFGDGFKRIAPRLIEPEEVEADYVISTHSHQDHFDADAIPVIARNPRTHFIGAPDCRDLYRKADIPEDRFTILHESETLGLDGFRLTGIYADHGKDTPDALGLWLDFNGITVWQVGDSAYRPEQWGDLFERGVDIIIPPINGAFGNLNEVEAAKLAQSARARLAIPCHFWMFALHHGDPGIFLEACKEHAPGVTPRLMSLGELFIYQK
jgi:L-ascorbate 6-phosphate lactonase